MTPYEEWINMHGGGIPDKSISDAFREGYAMGEEDLKEFYLAVMEASVNAGYPGGDRTQVLANVRDMARELISRRDRP